MKQDEIIPSFYKKEILILGCGNVLFGDDGFGPSVVERLLAENHLPGQAEALDVGTGVREILFTILLAEKKPKLILLVDAIQHGAPPGSLREISLDEIPPPKRADLSLHQAPTTNLLRELRDQCGVGVSILAVQPAFIPNHVAPGLSPQVAAAIPSACKAVFGIIQSAGPCREGVM